MLIHKIELIFPNKMKNIHIQISLRNQDNRSLSHLSKSLYPSPLSLYLLSSYLPIFFSLSYFLCRRCSASFIFFSLSLSLSKWSPDIRGYWPENQNSQFLSFDVYLANIAKSLTSFFTPLHSCVHSSEIRIS